MYTLILIAARNLVQHRRRTLMLGGAIAAVTALLVILLGLSTGIRETMLRSATTLMTGHINVAGFYKITEGQSAPVVTGYKKVLEVIQKNVPELDYVVERGRGWGKLVSDTGVRQVGIAGIDVVHEPGFKKVIQVKSGRLEDLAEPNTLLLFEGQATKLDVKVGDMLTISSSTTRGVANTIDVKLVAVAQDVGLLSMWNIYIPSETLRRLYELNDDTTGALMLYLKDISKIPEVEARLRNVLEKDGARLMEKNPVAFFMKFDSVNREAWSGQKIDITNWEDEISFMSWTFKTLNALSAMLIGILLVIIVVGIMNTMWIAIRERTREIGTLRAIGMQRTRVLVMFVLEALLLGLAGTGSGALVGLLAAGLLNSAGITVPIAAQLFLMSDKLWLSVHAASVITAIVSISLVTTLASLYPAYRAARLKPVTAMHHIG